METTKWIQIEKQLPPMEVPVWLYMPDIGQPVIGCRSDGDDGWVWCRCYDDFWFADGEWKTGTAEEEDAHPSHWMALPCPPQTGGGK